MQEITRTILEFLFVGVVGLILGLAANYYNPDGLSLTRDYFAKPGADVTTTQQAASSPGTATQPDHSDADAKERQQQTAKDQNREATNYENEYRQALKERMENLGVEIVDFEQVKAWFKDPGYEYGAYVFVDARNQEQYRQGHIPGAWLLDHFRIERYIDEVLPMCQGAEAVVVYCSGGQCEDSEYVVGDLLNFGINPSVIHLYVDGLEEWIDKGMPLELGRRNSGRMRGGQE
jgi:rhodanese-related sulfurtransferase